MPSISVDARSEIARQALISALAREQALARNAISRTKERLKGFEQKYGMKMEEFYERFKSGELGDSDDYIDWAGEYELLKHLEEEEREAARVLEQCKPLGEIK
jgi:hemerythrin-like domain-containing protein